MSLSDIFSVTPRLVLLLAGLLVPGAALLRAGRLPWSLAASFVSSGVLLYLSVLGCTLLHAPITPGSLSLCLILFSAAGILVAARHRTAIPREEPGPWAFLTSLGRWTPLYLAFWVVVIHQLATNPLSGPDVHFRWSHLAEQMLRHGSLEFYPPRTGDNFVSYFWAESVPPGIASVYAWAYGCGGSHDPLWTSPVVLLQLLSAHELVWRLGCRHGGIGAGRFALLLVAACPLLTWSFLIGQETGLLAAAVCGLVWCLDRSRQTHAVGWAMLGGVFAVAAASTREYGLAYAVLAVAAAALNANSRRRGILIAAAACAVAAIWPLRVWAMTGNPFFSLSVGGLFPTNSVFIAWNDEFRAAQRTALGSAAAWGELLRYLALWALPAGLGVLALLWTTFRRFGAARLLSGFAGLTAVLWFVSVSFTAGGLFYSLRVLAPAFALSIVAASWLIAAYNASAVVRRWLPLGIALLSLEALPKTLVLPDNPYRVPFRNWATASRQITESFHVADPELAAKLARLPGRRRIVSDGFDLPELGARVGLEVAPLWSPEFRWLVDSTIDPAMAARQWQSSGLRFLVMGRTGPMAAWLPTHAQMRTTYFTIDPVDQTDTHVILEIRPTGVPIP